MPKTQESTSYQLLNWNCPRRLKTSLDAVVDYKRCSRTSIVNSLLDEYVRKELSHIKEDGRFHDLIEVTQKKYLKKPEEILPIQNRKSEMKSWEKSYS